MRTAQAASVLRLDHRANPVRSRIRVCPDRWTGRNLRLSWVCCS